MPSEGKFVLGLEEPDYPPQIHDQENPEVLNHILRKITLVTLVAMVIIFIIGLMSQFPVSFIPAGIIILIVLNKKNAKRKAGKRDVVVIRGIPQGNPRQRPTASNRSRRNPSNLRQSGFRR